MKFVSSIYQRSNFFPKVELYGITNQARKAAVSIPSNIAEGASRSSIKERCRFFNIACSSLEEIDTHIEISNRLGYLSTDNLDQLSATMNKIFAMLTKLIQKTR
jgi:four helix bundle protein